MKKRFIKMVLYGEPGVGKSTFASKFPKPFFICTDGNFDWLDLPDENHVQVNSWEEAKKVFSSGFENFETVVVDLTEDLFKWCEKEYCVRNKIDHISDVGFGKGYDTTRNEFFIEICKLLNLEKNVLLLMHGITYTVKDRRGVEHTKFGPSSRLPDKVIDMIEGRVRYFLRCYVKDIDLEDGTIMKERFLSVVPKPNEFGIIRGIDENKVPQDIPLDFNEFVNIVGYDVVVEQPEQVEEKHKRHKKVEEQVEKAVEKTNEEVPPFEVEEKKEEVKPIEKTEVKHVEEKTEVKPMTNEDKIAAIKAKLAAMKKN